MTDVIPTISSKRIVGLDVARSLAIAGMALIHFDNVLSSVHTDPSALRWCLERLAGRPAAIFMVLAGIGVSLRVVGCADRDAVAQVRRSLWKRGLFFLVVGSVNLAIWPGDILRVYGIAYMLAAMLLLVSNRWLWGAVATTMVLFVGMLLAVDFETNWNFETLEYANLWTPSGATMNMFYNGFRAVLPWVGLLFVGMLIGRLNLRDQKVRRQLMAGGLLLWVAAEAASFGLLRATLPLVSGADREAVVAIFGTDSLPPLPLFLLSSAGLAIAVIALCIQLTEHGLPELWAPFVSAGQMAFTWYIGHILVVVVAGAVTDFRSETPLLYSMLAALVFCELMFAISWGYRRWFRSGPLEWVLRRVA